MGPVNGDDITRRPALSVKARAFGARAGRWLSGTSYLKKWVVLGAVIGVIAGLGAVVFYEALVLSTRFFLGFLVGYHVPSPIGEKGFVGDTSAARLWLLPIVTGVGALLGALLVFKIAPEAEGHGTDAAIHAVHHNPRGIRARAVVVKIVASALTIGSGGSGGREGPAAQISAGFGSLLSRMLDLEPADSRVAVATGIGSGIGAIFGAPLGGAVLASEILYRDDYDSTALLPCFIASVVSYAIFGVFVGWLPLFGYVGGYEFSDPVQLLWFALIGLLGGLLGLLYAKSFYGLAALFLRLPLPRWLGPTIGGVAVGLIGLVIPQVLGTGYGWVQKGLGLELLTLPLWIVIILPLAKILATGLSIGSGGSGGIFGPGMFIGAFLGAAVWRVFEPIAPSMGHNPAPVRDRRHDVLLRRHLPGSAGDHDHGGRDDRESLDAGAGDDRRGHLLAHRPPQRRDHLSSASSRAVRRPRRSACWSAFRCSPGSRRSERWRRRGWCWRRDLLTGEARATLSDAGVAGAPVVDEEERFEGAVLEAELEHHDGTRALGRMVDPGAPSVPASSRLDVALEALNEGEYPWVTVLDDDRRVVGTLSISDLVRAYRRELAASFSRLTDLEAGTAAFDVDIPADSPAVGMRLRSAGLPMGVLVTSITRAGDVVLPTGDTVLLTGDRLSVLGGREGMEKIGVVVSPRPATP